MSTTTKRTADVIRCQAERLGCVVDDVSTASTGTVYITLSHESWGDDDRLIRVADHEPNDARYTARISRRPDMDVEAGHQAQAVAALSAWLGVDPSTIAYLKSAATRQTNRADREVSRRARDRRWRDHVDTLRRALLRCGHEWWPGWSSGRGDAEIIGRVIDACNWPDAPRPRDVARCYLLWLSNKRNVS